MRASDESVHKPTLERNVLLRVRLRLSPERVDLHAQSMDRLVGCIE